MNFDDQKLIYEQVKYQLNSVLTFKENLLRSLVPNSITSDEEAINFLRRNNVRFVEWPDGKQELRGFGKTLGLVEIGVIEEDKDAHISHLVNRFTPYR